LKQSVYSIQTLYIDEDKKVNEEKNFENNNNNPVIVEEGTLEATMQDGDETRVRAISILTQDGAYDELESEGTFLEYARKLNEAMQLLNTCEKDVIDVIIKGGNTERVERLKEIYVQEYEEDLMKAIKRNIGGRVQSILINCLLPVEEYVSTLQRECIETKNYSLLTEVLSTYKPQVVQAAKLLYKECYNDQFESHVNTSLDQNVTESLRNVMVPLSHLQRNNVNVESMDEQTLIKDDIAHLNEGGDNIVEILTQKPYSTARLAVLFQKYKLEYYLDIKESIELEFHDEAQTCLKTIVRTASNLSEYFAEELKKAFHENKEDRIVHIIVSRYQIDLTNINETYQQLTDESLLKSLERSVSSDIKYILMRLILKSNN